MKDENAIQSEIEELKTFQILINAYTEIAAIRMRKTRGSVLKNREFLAKLDDVFSDVRVSYAKEVLKLGTKKDANKEKITFLAHNGKAVGLFLSANTGLYGDIVERTFDLFIREVRESNMEIAIVGKLGLQYLQSREPNRPYTYFDLSDREVEANQLSLIIKHLVQYEEIRVYYPTFQTAVTQNPSKYTISAETPLTEIKRKEKYKTGYLFEPSLKEILVFFEKEIFASLLDQTVRDAQLAKYASRIMALDRAGENIKKELDELSLNKLRTTHTKQNKKQLTQLINQFV